MEFSIWERALLTALILLSVLLFARHLSPRIAAIRTGRHDRVRTDRLGGRLATTFTEVLLQTRVIGGRPVAGAMHAAVFFGFLFFALETSDHFLKAYGPHLLQALFGLQAPLYEGLVAFWAVLVSIAIVGLAYRRFVMVKISPDPKSYSSGVVALLILALMLSFLYAQTSPPATLAKANWWFHAAVILLFPHLILRSKHFHIVMAPINIFFRTERLSELLPLDLDLEALEAREEEPSFGLESLGDLSWKQRMDFLTCVECRRCTDNCPANLAGQELDPRGFVLAGRECIFTLANDAPAIGNVISERALGQCTSCGACEAICPVGIEHLQLLTGAKRAQALALGTGMVADDFLKTIERSGNPFGQPADARGRLIRELDIPSFVPGETEYLLWLGCVWSYNADARRSVESMIRILRSADTGFGVLEHEPCCGHHSRRQGEEMQFQSLARDSIEILTAARVGTILTACPHCLHTLRREYPTLDGTFQPEVVHHSELLAELLAAKRLRIDPARNGDIPATYHDPCYLGRYEEQFDAPREVIRSCGLRLAEMDRSRERALCCGGGSAGFARETEEELRVDQLRTTQVRDTGARLLVTSCPECKMMLDAAVDETRDIAEVVAAALV